MKLEEIDRDNIFKVPESYFDELPVRIQSKISSRKRKFLPDLNWSVVLKVSISLAAILFFVLYLGPQKTQNELSEPENLLAQVSADDVIAYLELEDIWTNDIIAQIDIREADLWQDDEDPLIDELDLDEEQLIDLIDAFKTGKDYL